MKPGQLKTGAELCFQTNPLCNSLLRAKDTLEDPQVNDLRIVTQFKQWNIHQVRWFGAPCPNLGLLGSISCLKKQLWMQRSLPMQNDFRDPNKKNQGSSSKIRDVLKIKSGMTYLVQKRWVLMFIYDILNTIVLLYKKLSICTQNATVTSKNMYNTLFTVLFLFSYFLNLSSKNSWL